MKVVFAAVSVAPDPIDKAQAGESRKCKSAKLQNFTDLDLKFKVPSSIYMEYGIRRYDINIPIYPIYPIFHLLKGTIKDLQPKAPYFLNLSKPFRL